MASRGRVRDKKCFAFGSSTPRDLSYMHKVPLRLRTYDSKPSPGPPPKQDETLSHYMRQARSVPPNFKGSRDSSTDRLPASFAFGSSTPRQFSHLSAIPSDLRVYDVKMRPQVEKRSHTTPVISTTRSQTVPATARVKPSVQKKKERSDDEDEIASEPDFVQDRHDRHSLDFMQSIKKQLQSQRGEREEKKDLNENALKGKDKANDTRHENGITTETEVKRPQVRKASGFCSDDEITDLPLEASQPCVLPQNIQSETAELTAKSVPSVRPLDDSSEVMVQYDEEAPEEREAGFLGDLLEKESELKKSAADTTESPHLEKKVDEDKRNEISGMEKDDSVSDSRKDSYVDAQKSNETEETTLVKVQGHYSSSAERDPGSNEEVGNLHREADKDNQSGSPHLFTTEYSAHAPPQPNQYEDSPNGSKHEESPLSRHEIIKGNENLLSSAKSVSPPEFQQASGPTDSSAYPDDQHLVDPRFLTPQKVTENIFIHREMSSTSPQGSERTLAEKIVGYKSMRGSSGSQEDITRMEGDDSSPKEESEEAFDDNGGEPFVA